MTESHEKFKNIAEGIKNLLIAAAVLAGGGWAYYEFSALLNIERAKAELENIAQNNFKQVNLQMNITASSEYIKKDNVYTIIGTVHIKNIGNTNALITYPETDPPIRISKVEYDEITGQLEYKSTLSFSFSNSKFIFNSAYIRSGIESKKPLIVSVKEPGLYMINFQADVHSSDNLVLKTHPDSSEGAKRNIWNNSIIVNIKDGSTH